MGACLSNSTLNFTDCCRVNIRPYSLNRHIAAIRILENQNLVPIYNNFEEGILFISKNHINTFGRRFFNLEESEISALVREYEEAHTHVPLWWVFRRR